ncbi:AraC family transcriptional regulator [Rubellicoccus peritrichatus]|uniref:AraC family transcriptional regulator n=1 Tax=Rubellicoccus peritrichatus TaxID=3080537 RepID=A0AAQ3LB96_9BACT|nr:AraC family transcriptional regulator [Puniceicoccus sp. CR14]WOO40750.1 AraC family transcriptional regulator [Puniceicoccus sp. CR14]
MLENLKISDTYDGFLYLSQSELNPRAIGSHRHVELELNLVVRGELTYVVGGKRYVFSKGTLLWFFPAQEHQLVHRTPDANNYVGVFKPEMIAETCRGDDYGDLKREDINCEGILNRQLRPESFDLLKGIMDTLMVGSLDSALLNREAGFGSQSSFRFEHNDPDALNAGLRYLLILCWRLSQEKSERDSSTQLHPAVYRALQLLGEGELAGLDDIASRCGVSAAYLSRLFREQVGVPLNHYRNSIRLSRFMSYYRQPEQKTLLESVFAAGFGSYAQFYKVFLETYGYGPREYFKR